MEHKFGRWGTILLVLGSGSAGAIAAALITRGDRVVQTQTVSGPVVTQYVAVDKAKGEPCSGTRVAGGPPYEPNELVATAYGPLRVDIPINAALESDDDVDFFAFCLARTTRIGAQLRQTDCRLTRKAASDYDQPNCMLIRFALYDDNGKELEESSVDADTTVGGLKVTRRPAGRYFVRIADGDGFRYELRLRSDDPTAVIPTVSPATG